jgi:type VI protein secretion system component VasK
VTYFPSAARLAALLARLTAFSPAALLNAEAHWSRKLIYLFLGQVLNAHEHFCAPLDRMSSSSFTCTAALGGPGYFG